jgi:hypothetical protein
LTTSSTISPLASIALAKFRTSWSTPGVGPPISMIVCPDSTIPDNPTPLCISLPSSVSAPNWSESEPGSTDPMHVTSASTVAGPENPW